MLSRLLYTNLHFTINIFVALIFFATGWLHYSSWTLEKKGKIMFARSLGFFLLAIMSIGQATSIGLSGFVFALQIVKIVGLAIILASLIKEPALQPPKNEVAAISLILISQFFVPISALLYFIIALIYLRKFTESSEEQMKPMFLAFLLLAISEFINISYFGNDSQVVFWSNLLAVFGPVWMSSSAFKLIGAIMMGLLTWRYIRFRAQAQLFILFVTASLFIFTLTTFSFTFLLLNNLEKEGLSHLKTDVKLLQYAVDRLESEALADARVVADNSVLIDAIANNDSNKLYDTSLEFMLSQNTSFLEITNDVGKVVMRASDKDNIGDSLSEDPVVQSALSDQPLSAIEIKEAVMAPVVQIRASAPISLNNAVVGTAVTGFNIDSVFVDGVKNATGLNASVFAGDTRAATTFVSPDGKTRFIGTKETDANILSKVLTSGEEYIGPLEIHNQSYYAAYAPLKTSNDEIIGMLFVGKLQTELFETAERSIQYTFLGSVILMILSTIPAYIVAHYIKENIEA